MNRARRILGIYELSTGGVAGTVADPKLVFTAALKANACNIILSHNHPSGNLKPSKADEELTKKIKEAGIYLDIKVLDHIIVTSEGYYSFADEGVL
jgi:DNA repair protein RadC